MRLLQYSDIENAHDDPATIGGIAGTINALRDDRTLVCGTGDNIAPGVLPLVTKGNIALEFFEAIDPTVETFGNHDFDFGPTQTQKIVRRSPQRWLSANVERHGEPFARVDTWCIETVGDNRVGFFGLTDPKTPTIGDEAGELVFTDPIEAAQEAVERLRERDADYVVALSHLGRQDDRLAAECDIDVILGGHIHSERIERTAGTILTRPGTGGAVVMEIDLDTDEVTRHATDERPSDTALESRYRDRMADAGLDTVVAHVADPILRTDQEAFHGESRVGNFVADAYRWAALRGCGGAPPVIGLQNSGGIRTGPPLEGTITTADIISLVPFHESLIVAEVTGKELLAVLREAAETPGFGQSEWGHGHVSGVRMTYDYGSDQLRKVTVDGEPVIEIDTYRLATSAFLLHTDVEFPTLTKSHVIERLDVQYEILIEYAATEGMTPSIESRIVRRGLE